MMRIISVGSFHAISGINLELCLHVIFVRNACLLLLKDASKEHEQPNKLSYFSCLELSYLWLLSDRLKPFYAVNGVVF